MHIEQTDIPGLLLIRPRTFGDQRGFFLETFRAGRYAELAGGLSFVQDNHSRSQRGVLRGLHYQLPHAQGKLIWAARGEIYDVALDLRRQSPTFLQWRAFRLDDQNHAQLYVPPGFAHGFCVLSDVADVIYKATDYYHPESEWCIRWDDPQLAIAWPIANPRLSDRDRRGLPLREAPVYEDLTPQP